MSNSIGLEEIIEELELKIEFAAEDLKNIKISGREVNRPGLQLAGFFKKFAYERVQIIGNVEWHYCNSLSSEERYKALEGIFKYEIPCVVVSREHPIFPEMLDLAKKYDRTILRTHISTTKFINKLLIYLDYTLSPKRTIHGVLIEVYGLGVLLIGNSGVGKSETALEMVKRGHRLVADDSVEVRRLDEKLRGQSPKLIRHFMEIRGIGILDIERLYGVGAVKKTEFIDLIIELENWDENKEYDRIGLDDEYKDILGIELPKLLVPVRPGRNLAMIIEVAARNTRQKRLGYNAAVELDKRIKEEIMSRRSKANK